MEDHEVLARQAARLAALTAAAGALLYAAEPARNGHSLAARRQIGAAVTLVLLVDLVQRLGLQAALVRQAQLRRMLPAWGAAASLASGFCGAVVTVWRGPVEALACAGALWLALAVRAAWIERQCAWRVAAARAGAAPGSRWAQRRLVAAVIEECHRRTGYTPARILPEVATVARQIAAALAMQTCAEPLEQVAVTLIVEHCDRQLSRKTRQQRHQAQGRSIALSGLVVLALIGILSLSLLCIWWLTWLLTLFARALRG